METDINDGFMPSNIGKRFQSKLVLNNLASITNNKQNE